MSNVKQVFLRPEALDMSAIAAQMEQNTLEIGLGTILEVIRLTRGVDAWNEVIKWACFAGDQHDQKHIFQKLMNRCFKYKTSSGTHAMGLFWCLITLSWAYSENFKVILQNIPEMTFWVEVTLTFDATTKVNEANGAKKDDIGWLNGLKGANIPGAHL